MAPREREEHQPRALWVLVGGLALVGVILAAVIASCTGSESSSGAATTTAATTAVTVNTPDSELESLAGTAGAADELSTLSGLLEDTGLGESLQGEGPLTLFAPTDEAFAAMPPDVLDEIRATPGLLGKVLSFYVVPRSVRRPTT